MARKLPVAMQVLGMTALADRSSGGPNPGLDYALGPISSRLSRSKNEVHIQEPSENTIPGRTVAGNPRKHPSGAPASRPQRGDGREDTTRKEVCGSPPAVQGHSPSSLLRGSKTSETIVYFLRRTTTGGTASVGGSSWKDSGWESLQRLQGQEAP
jgi:hypothetical protein